MDWKGFIWKSYFFLITILLCIGYARIVWAEHFIIDLLVSLPAYVGLFGLAFRRKIYEAGFWKVYFFVYIIWDQVYNLMIYPAATNTEFEASSFFGLILFIPLYIGLYLYAFRYMRDQ